MAGEVIIVTARRRQEDPQKVPVALSVFNGEDLRKAQTDRLEELTLKTPNMNMFQTRSSSSNGAIFIRGFGQEDTVFTVDSGVGLYVDDVFMPRAQAALLNVYDVERIEVLRGPQGTLYGRNTIAGAIKYVTRDPGNDLAATVTTTVGNYKRGDLKASLNLPLLSDRVLTRFSFGTFNHEGFERDILSGRRTRDMDVTAGRASVLVNVSEDLKVSLAGDYYADRSGISVGSLLRPVTTAMDFEGLVAQEQVTIPVSSDPFLVRSNAENLQIVDHWGLVGNVSWDASDMLSLKSVSSYRQLASNARLDFDSTEAHIADVFSIQDHSQWSQEIQANLEVQPVSLVGGLYYFHEYDNQNDGTDATAKGFSIDSAYDQMTDSVAGYANADYPVLDQLTLNAGVRVTFERKEFSRQSELHPGNPMTGDPNRFGGFDSGPNGNPPQPLFPGNGTRITNIRDVSETWTAVTPRAGVSHTPTEDVLLFASVARGFKSGGFNGRANQAANPDQDQPYAPEYVWTYEAGVKSSWLDRQFLANATGFYNDYTDLQLASFTAVDADGDGVEETYLPQFTNAGRAVTAGFELEVSARPIPGLVVSGGTGFTQAEYKQFVERGVDIAGMRDLPNAPKWTAALTTAYNRPIDAYVMEVGGGVNYQGARYLTVSNLEDLREDGYVLFDAFAAVAAQDYKWRLTLAGKNLGDERYLVSGLDASSPPFGLVTGFYGPPRLWMLTLEARF
jgi:iron complex outermembrane receptor protein